MNPIYSIEFSFITKTWKQILFMQLYSRWEVQFKDWLDL